MSDKTLWLVGGLVGAIWLYRRQNPMPFAYQGMPPQPGQTGTMPGIPLFGQPSMIAQSPLPTDYAESSHNDSPAPPVGTAPSTVAFLSATGSTSVPVQNNVIVAVDQFGNGLNSSGYVVNANTAGLTPDQIAQNIANGVVFSSTQYAPGTQGAM